MAYIDWMIRGPEIGMCNCDWGCPCQFNALPTRGDCRAVAAMRVDEGHFGNVRLDGLKTVAILAWPGAIHEGGGEVLPIVDERATPEQREALLQILGGEETEEFATIFNVVKATTETVHDPQFLPIEFEANEETRTGHVSVPGIIEANAEPIRNPVSGAEHRVKVVLPQGFEYNEAEYASCNVKTTGVIENEWTSRHAHLCTLHLGPHGIIH